MGSHLNAPCCGGGWGCLWFVDSRSLNPLDLEVGFDLRITVYRVCIICVYPMVYHNSHILPLI